MKFELIKYFTYVGLVGHLEIILWGWLATPYSKGIMYFAVFQMLAKES